MKRRDVLRTCGALAGLGVLAGCTTHSLQEAERQPPPVEPLGIEEIDLPVPQRLGIAAAAIERAADVSIDDPDGFAAYLDEQGVRVEKIEETVEAGAPLLELEYVVEETIRRGLMHHLGIVAGGYAALIDSGHESEELAVHLLDPDGTAFGEYEIRRHWAEKYNGGEYTARKYAAEIEVTAAST